MAAIPFCCATVAGLRSRYGRCAGHPRLTRRFAVLKERMNTHQTTYEGALERFRTSNEGALERLRTDIARWDEESARRKTRVVLLVVGMIVLATAIVGIQLAFLAFMIANITAAS